MSKRKPVCTDVCTNELWEGVRCALPAGHQGSHQRPATATSCAISWRASTAFPPPLPVQKSVLPVLRSITSKRPTMEMIR